jgi:mono/diheme cytochrome c family protein
MRALTLALLAGFAVASGSVALAEGKANPNRGKSLYKANCKACHTQGGGAKALTPLSKTQAQWLRFFKTGAASCLKKVEAKTGKALAPQDLADMQAFLVAHAADSDQPETCGQ